MPPVVVVVTAVPPPVAVVPPPVLPPSVGGGVPPPGLMSADAPSLASAFFARSRVLLSRVVVVGRPSAARHGARVAEVAEALDRDLADDVERLGLDELDQHGDRALVLALGELARGVAPLLLPRRLVHVGGLRLDQLDQRGHVRGLRDRDPRGEQGGDHREATHQNPPSWRQQHLAGVRAVGRAIDAQRLAGRRRDAVDDEALVLGGQPLDPVDAPAPVEAVIAVAVDRRHRDRAAVDEPPARALRGALGIRAVVELAALSALGPRTTGDVIARAARDHAQRA